MSRTKHHRGKRKPATVPERWCKFCNRVCWLMLEIHGVRYDDVGDRLRRFKQRRESQVKIGDEVMERYEKALRDMGPE